MQAVAFSFDAAAHEYRAGGAVLPHITGMLEQTGWIDDRWFKEEHSIRGQAVHKLTADYDLGALEPKSCTSHYKGWLLGHVEAMKILRPEILEVETPLVHSKFRFGGRPDRVARVHGQLGILELKSGGKEKSHPIQTALQAILASEEHSLPPEAWARYCIYLKPNGKFKCERHDRGSDFTEAYAIIRRCCQ